MKQIIAAGTLVVALIAAYVYVWPAYQEVEATQAELDEHDLALEKIGEFKSLRDTYLAQYNDLPEEQVQRMETLLPNVADRLRLVMNIDAFATEFGVEITGIEVAEPEDRSGRSDEQQNNDPYETIEVSFAFEDNYNSLIAFLEGLESRLRLLDVTSIKVDTNTDGPTSYSYSVTLRTYALQ
ncbi:MAG: type 4a pilus biogenesis protein PilO [Candidatus Paceibacterota bacterium]